MNPKAVKRLTLVTGVVLLLVALTATLFLVLRPRPSLSVPAAAQPTALTEEYKGQPQLGAAKAPVKLILFENFLCEHCKAFEASVFGRLERDYLETGRVEAYYVNLAWGEADAVRAGRAGECAFRQNPEAFWAYKRVLFEAQGAAGWATLERLVALAGNVAGLEPEALRTCVTTGATQAEVTRDLALADFVGVTGTPSVVVGDQGFEAPDFATLARAIDAQLASLE